MAIMAVLALMAIGLRSFLGSIPILLALPIFG
jgi:hypothetical protein